MGGDGLQGVAHARGGQGQNDERRLAHRARVIPRRLVKTAVLAPVQLLHITVGVETHDGDGAGLPIGRLHGAPQRHAQGTADCSESDYGNLRHEDSFPPGGVAA